jgi:hypothetical protein
MPGNFGRRALACVLSSLLAASAQAGVVETVAALPPALAAPPIAAPFAAPALGAGFVPFAAPAATLSAPALDAAPAAALAAPAAVPAAAAAVASAAAAEPSSPGPAPASAARPAPVPSPNADAGLLSGRAFDGAAARAALESAAGKDYVVHVLTRRQDGRDRVVVLLGEFHHKSVEAAALGRAVIERFRTYGLEGYKNESPAAKKFFSDYKASAERLAEIAPKQYAAGSTIDEAQRLVQTRAEAFATVRRFLDAFPPAERRRMLESARFAVENGTPENVVIKSGGRILLDAAGVREVLLSMDNGTESALEHAFVPRQIRLEQGHEVGRAENIALRGQDLRRWARKTYSYALLAVMASLVIPHGLWLAAALCVPQAYVRLGDALPRRVMDGPAGLLFPLRTGLVRGRDRTMARNIALASASDDGADPVLAIVGAGHSPGLARRLTREHGFAVAGLDALSAR